MSFILDALKKSENDRQDSSPAEFTTVASGGQAPQAPRWLWVLGGLLLINAIVLGLLLLRPDAPPPAVELAPPTPAPAPATAQSQQQATPAAASDTSGSADFSARIAEARRDRPPPQTAVPTTAPPVTVTNNAPAEPAQREIPPPAAGADRQTLLLPTLTEVRANGTLSLPDMHLDIHVYSEAPNDRFVFINMSKYRERESTKEGPEVTEITPEGVVLDFQGRTFLLPRE